MEKRRTILIYLVSLVLLVSSVALSASAQTISIDPENIEANHGESFTIDIKVDPEGAEIYGAQYVVFFDSEILNATSQTQGAFLGGTIVAYEIDNPGGTIDYGEYRTGSDGVTNPGVLASVTFEVIGTSGTSHLKLDGVILSDPDGQKIQDVTINHGSFSIAQPSTPFLIYGYVSYEDESVCNNPTVNITNLNIGKEWTAKTNETSNRYQTTLANCADIIAGDILQFNAASSDGSQSSVTEHTVTHDEVDDGGFEYNITLEHRPGDVNGDGIITPADAIIALQMAVCGEYDSVADVNHDDAVTSLDALMILQTVDGI